MKRRPARAKGPFMKLPRLSHIAGLAALALAVGLTAAPAWAAASGTFTTTGSMSTVRTNDTATLLQNGEVLIAGGAFGGTPTLTSAELYNPATGTFTPTGSMVTQHVFQTATLLAGGQVLVAGGGTNAAELYNPATGKFTATGSMTTGRVQASAALLNNGQVLVAGGGASTAELYNPATGKFTATGSMDVGRRQSNAVRLQDGDVLVTSGIGAGGPFAELYHPATGTWSDAIGGMATCTPVQDCRFYSSETLLANGNVLVAGGMTGLASNPSTTATAMVYNPATNAWTATGAMNTNRGQQTATLLNSGQVLVAGGISFHAHRATELASAELYTP